MAAGNALTGLTGNYRRALIAALVVGGVGLIVSSVLGHPIAGAMFCVGLAMGLINSRLAVASVARYTTGGNPSKRRFMFGAMQRLAAITAIALALVLTFYPDGLGVLLGLALFQLVMLGSTSGALLREVRKG